MLLACGEPEPEPSDEANDPSPDPADTAGSAPDDEPVVVCRPGELRCGSDPTTINQCAATGLNWETSPCGTHQQCEPCFGEQDDECVAACVGPCERVGDDPSSAGCSFWSTTTHWTEAFFVANPDQHRTATVELRLTPLGSNVEELGEGPLEIGPGESHVFEVPETTTWGAGWNFPSKLRSGGVRHIVSDLPVSVRRHSPGIAAAHRSSASLSLPEHMHGYEYVVYGYPPGYYIDVEGDVNVNPNYFTVIGLHNQTTVRWWPTSATAGDGLPLPFVAAGDMGERRINRFDNMRIASSSKLSPPVCEHDLSGTVVVADKPIWLESAVLSTNIPNCSTTGCENDYDACYFNTSDVIIEQNLPIAAWGTEYVGPHAPSRGGDETVFWRVFAGADNVRVVVSGAPVGSAIELATRGDWAELELPADVNLRFSGDGKFMPVQYVTGFHASAVQQGGPTMVQMIPTSAYLDRYVFELRSPPGDAVVRHAVTLTRPAGGAEVSIDAVVVSEDWEHVDGWEVTTAELTDGAHVIESDDPVGAVVYGYVSKDQGPYTNGAGLGCALGLRSGPGVTP